MYVNNLPKNIACQQNGRELNSRPLQYQANALAITLPGHTITQHGSEGTEPNTAKADLHQ